MRLLVLHGDANGFVVW